MEIFGSDDDLIAALSSGDEESIKGNILRYRDEKGWSKGFELQDALRGNS